VYLYTRGLLVDKPLTPVSLSHVKSSPVMSCVLIYTHTKAGSITIAGSIDCSGLWVWVWVSTWRSIDLEVYRSIGLSTWPQDKTFTSQEVQRVYKRPCASLPCMRVSIYWVRPVKRRSKAVDNGPGGLVAGEGILLGPWMGRGRGHSLLLSPVLYNTYNTYSLCV